MFTTIQPTEIKDNTSLMADVFRLRKKVFSDQLNWKVPVQGDMEKDAYDEMGASYLVWCSDDKSTLYGLVRLMPTSGPTLLNDVFHATHGRNPKLCDPEVWEGTRMCLDEELISRDFPDLNPGQAFSMLFVALCEAALAHNIRRLVSNFEPSMSRIYRRAGLSYQIHGRADGYGAKPVYCASFDVSQAVLHKMREKTGILPSVFVPSSRFAPLVPHGLPEVSPELELAL